MSIMRWPIGTSYKTTSYCFADDSPELSSTGIELCVLSRQTREELNAGSV